jgi:hypothetical protein
VVIGLLTEVDDVVGPIATSNSAEVGADRYEDRSVDRAAMGGTSREMLRCAAAMRSMATCSSWCWRPCSLSMRSIAAWRVRCCLPC